MASILARAGVSPNQISAISVLFAAVGAALLLAVPGPIGLTACAACVQARLLCNMLDGMVAVEGGRQTSMGALYNEFPDRLTDSIFLVALGYAIHAPWLGWLAALIAAFTAYIRVFGGSLGLAQDFRGPMAKPHRMAVLTAGCVIGAIEHALWGSPWAMTAAAIVIAVGSAVTCVTRAIAMANEIRRR